jgi:hypothetical protein
MLKEARKPSTDPIQEKLRQDKAALNKTVSEFIDDLIHFKKLMNGHPNKFHPEKSKINDPIPADAVTIIGSLANDFNEIATKTNKIIQQQNEYSKNRKKRQPKQMNLPFASPASPQLNLPGITSIYNEYNLIAEGSNPITRFFARLLNPGIGGSEKARVNKYRMSLLSSAVDTWKNLEKLQEIIMLSSPESIFSASKLLYKIENQWSFIIQGFLTYETSAVSKEIKQDNNLENETISNNNTTNVIDEDPALLALKDFQRNADNFIELDLKSVRKSALDFVKKSKNSKMKEDFLLEYNNLIAAANIKFGTNGKTLEEIFIQKNNLKSEAQNFMTKYLGKAKHQLNPFDKTSAFRLDIYKFAKIAKQEINKVMNLLEKGMSINELKPLITSVGNHIFSIREVMKSLDSTIRGINFNKPFMEALEERNIFEHNPNLTIEQKERLKKLIEMRSLRNITNTYVK